MGSERKTGRPWPSRPRGLREFPGVEVIWKAESERIRAKQQIVTLEQSLPLVRHAPEELEVGRTDVLRRVD